MNIDELQLVVELDGAGRLFQDPSKGPELRMMVNNHMVDRWHYFYHKKVSFPYVRKVGVKGDSVKFKEGEKGGVLQVSSKQRICIPMVR